MNSDFLIVGGGIAGLSAAARLAQHGRVVVIEAEEAPGYHSSGRSVTFSHYGIGNETVRGLTSWSRGFFQRPPEDFSEVPLSKRTPALFFAREETRPELEALYEKTERLTETLTWLDEAGMKALCPVLKTGEGGAVAAFADSGGLKLDPHALLQGYIRAVRSHGGEVATGQRIATIEPSGDGWSVVSQSGSRWSAPVLVNAAGSWADGVAALAGVRPLGLEPKRRTIIVLDPPPELDVSGWAFTKYVVDEFYMLPDAGRLLASPVDEVPSDPCDCQPEEYDIALAAYRVEEFTTLTVQRIASRWAGLRTFTADRVPTAGFAPDAPGFFWLAGQGGYGLQTAPAMAEISAALISGSPWPQGLTALGVTAAEILPDRFA
jgi:D-arginine dehydrogenase